MNCEIKGWQEDLQHLLIGYLRSILEKLPVIEQNDTALRR